MISHKVAISSICGGICKKSSTFAEICFFKIKTFKILFKV
jgi:hypothetical protein